MKLDERPRKVAKRNGPGRLWVDYLKALLKAKNWEDLEGLKFYAQQIAFRLTRRQFRATPWTRREPQR